MGQQLGDDVTASITGGRTRNSQFSSSGHQRLRPCLVPHQTQNILNFSPIFWEMDLNITQNFLETHTHSEFWFLESRGQNKPNLGLVHVLLAHTAPIAARPHCPRTLPGARSGAAAAALLARSGVAAAALSHSLLARTLPAARPQRLLPLPGFLPHLHRTRSFPPSA